jgi:hypothetical protein
MRERSIFPCLEHHRKVKERKISMGPTLKNLSTLKWPERLRKVEKRHPIEQNDQITLAF